MAVYLQGRGRRTQITSKLRRMNAKKQTIPQGYRRVPGFGSLAINREGRVYDLESGRHVAPDSKNRFKMHDEIISIPKLVLSVYGQQPYQKRGYIYYMDGNPGNLDLNNLRYGRPPREALIIDPARLMTAIRCYFHVRRRFKVRDQLRTRHYLACIAGARNFCLHNDRDPGADLFAAYISKPLLSQREIAAQSGKSLHTIQALINTTLNRLISDVLADLDAGRLSVKDYQPRKKTRAQILKEYRDFSATLKRL